MNPSQSLRTWLDWLRVAGRLKAVSRHADLVHELAAVVHRLDGHAAVLFKHPGGRSVPVVAGTCCRREDFAAALGTDVSGILGRFTECQAHPRLPRLLAPGTAPAQEIRHTSGVDLLHLFPIPTHHEKDAGPYITAGVCIVRDAATGWHNLSIHRLQVVGPDRLTVLLLPLHTGRQFAAAEKAGRPLEIAIAVGLGPLLLLASQATTAPGVSEYGIAAAMLGDVPLDLVRGISVDIQIPAEAEIIIEGQLLPGVREPEGPVGGFPKYYGPRSLRPVVAVTAVTHRRDPIWQTILPSGMEHLLLRAIPKEAHMLEVVRQSVPTVCAVHLTPGGACRYHAVVQIQKGREGEARQAALAALAANFDVKHVVVVDDDVNIFDPQEVEWAVATRVRADRDIFFVPRDARPSADPSAADGGGTTMGIDATAPIDSRVGRDGEPGAFERIRIPDAANIRLEEYLDAE
jgi:2,5-furandicarboxylate decarboxylase 1